MIGDHGELGRVIRAGEKYDFRLRTHLTNIQGFADLLADPGIKLTPTQQWKYREIIKSSAEAAQIENQGRLDVLRLLCGPGNEP